jgi:hypothetical protein
MLEDTLSSEMLPSLRSAWTARARDLSRQRYERYADLLYAHLLNHLTAQKITTFNLLHARIQTATKPQDLEVPLWSYTSCYSKVREEPLYDTRIGTKVFGIPALPSVAVYKVVHETDILHRLAAAYGTDFYIYDRHVETLQENDRRVQSRRELVLTYYPCGLPDTLHTRIQDAKARQLNRIPYSPSWAETLSLVEPLQTPPPSRPSTPPPQRQRRCPCDSDDIV